MSKINLIKRDYIGEGFFYYFKNKSGNVVTEECTAQEYKKLGEKNGHLNNPERVGLIFIGAIGGAYKVNSPSGLLGNSEYAIVDQNNALVVIDSLEKFIPKEKIVNDQINDTDFAITSNAINP